MKPIYFLLPILVSSSLHALTLQEAIKISIDTNPKTVANQLRVQAMEDRLKAQKLSWLPTVTTTLGTDLSRSKYSSEMLDRSSSSRENSVGASTSFKLYDGGADKFATLEAEANLKAMKARYSSSNALIPNTRGSIAREVIDAYAGLLEVIEQQKYLGFISGVLQTYATAFRGDDLVVVQQKINDLKTSNIKINFNHEQALKDFKYFTTVEAPAAAELDTIQQAIQSLVIPANADEAFRIALDKNPNIKMAEYDVESSQYGYEAGRARRNSPQISLQASTNRSLGNTNDTLNRSGRASIGVYLSYTLDAKKSHFDAASVKTLEAAKNDLSAMTKETKYTIETFYPNLENQENVFRSQLENLKSADDSLNQILAKIKAGQTVDINVALNVLSAHQQYTYQSITQQVSILYTRFNIQRSVGTLFDNLGGLRQR